MHNNLLPNLSVSTSCRRHRQRSCPEYRVVLEILRARSRRHCESPIATPNSSSGRPVSTATPAAMRQASTLLLPPASFKSQARISFVRCSLYNLYTLRCIVHDLSREADHAIVAHTDTLPVAARCRNDSSVTYHLASCDPCDWITVNLDAGSNVPSQGDELKVTCRGGCAMVRT